MRRRVRAERARANDLEAEQRTVHTKLTAVHTSLDPPQEPHYGDERADPLPIPVNSDRVRLYNPRGHRVQSANHSETIHDTTHSQISRGNLACQDLSSEVHKMDTEPDPTDGSLTPAQRRIATELRLLDPSLEGLYREGVSLSKRSAAPGLPYLLAHAGRELSRGVIRVLSKGRETPGAADAAPDDERNRTTIATVLELPSTHGVVTEWFRANAIFAENCHHQPTPASLEVVVLAFERLNKLLFAVLAPYFDAKPELDRLLIVEDPSPGDLANLKTILARPALRHRFFRDASLPGWLPALQEWGVFADPPDRHTNADGSWCTASGFLDSGLTVFASTPPRPARGGRVAPGPGFGSRTSPASTARCTSA